MKTLILDNYDSFTYNLYQYCAQLNANPVVARNDKITTDEIEKNGYTHIIISPGPGYPNNKKDFGVCGKVIKKFTSKLPILGVCLGHQGIIHCFGGRIIRAPVPVHGKRSLIRIQNLNTLFKGLPEVIEAMRYHSLIGDAKKIPEELDIIAETTNDHLVMAVAHKKFPLFGVQFHPESIGTPHGKKILQNFLETKMPMAETDEKKTEEMFYAMTSGKMSEEEMEKILLEIVQRGERTSEIIGIANGMRKLALPLPTNGESLMDTCGTGGSGLKRMNISTTAAFVLAACGVKIAKHGNRAASGRCGSFDLLENLGVNIQMSPEGTAAAIHKLGIGFIFAPMFHPAMKCIAPVRKKLGIRTIFNLLGPLTNPAKPVFHLLGAPSREIAEKMVNAMKNLEYIRALVVSGKDGLDDITLTSKTFIFDLNRGKISEYEFLPEQVGFSRVNFEEISGGSAQENAKLFIDLLQNKAPEAMQNLLLLNAGFGLVAREFAKDIFEGIKIARHAIKTGAVYEKFLAYKNFSNGNLL